MTELRLVASAPLDGDGGGTATAVRLPPGRHGLPTDLVRAHQRQRLLEACAAALAEQGYGRITAARVTELAGVSSRTFYQHFEDLWACLLAAFETEAAHLCASIEGACARPSADRRERARAGIGAALDFLAEEPAIARLLSAEPPPQVTALAGARRDLVERLGGMLRGLLAPSDATPLPGLERRLIGAAMALVSTRAAGGEPKLLRELEPELSELLLASL
ncbi:MAG TPA: TetR/AcrR family transcriptional regulator [Solirubrobacterales bacterium]|jgi:AcrR family transcriptional regulator|nr:TetR/AcrR family transcriptional regulator [Solirubrobacterales bacterium]